MRTSGAHLRDGPLANAPVQPVTAWRQGSLRARGPRWTSSHRAEQQPRHEPRGAAAHRAAGCFGKTSAVLWILMAAVAWSC
jgi:hypothetical protein